MSGLAQFRNTTSTQQPTPIVAEWYVYILQCADRTLYTGVTTDITARVVNHNAGKGAKYTRSRLPAVLVYQEKASDHGAALRREHAIKQMRAEEKRRLFLV
ncbi:GIY-YIG nuclease family protein [Sulfuriferula sp. GW1]|uniref:GIY-YIG nuclease family protein n=1 Tax=Sulfuriferula sp. GW1 TaxID=3345111 RepID=UPI0039AECF08